MLSEREIYLAAQAMIRRYGDEADVQAAIRADELMAAGDMEGQRTWLRIVQAIETLRKDAPGEGEQRH
jgi:hypothetical protein